METENSIAREVVDAAYHLHKVLGPGLLESIYEATLAYELELRDLKVIRQMPIPISYKGLQFDEGFRADLLVNDKLIIELKSVEKTLPVHKKQRLTYLRLTDMKLGLLINFGSAIFKDGVTRLALQTQRIA